MNVEWKVKPNDKGSATYKNCQLRICHYITNDWNGDYFYYFTIEKYKKDTKDGKAKYYNSLWDNLCYSNKQNCMDDCKKYVDTYLGEC